MIVFDFSQFLKFIFERVESLKREFQFYNYGSSDVNISDFVYGGYNIVARVFVFKKLFFFLIVRWLWNRKEEVYEIQKISGTKEDEGE